MKLLFCSSRAPLSSIESLLSPRPIRHKCDETVRGYVCCPFLALVLNKSLENRLEAAGNDEGWTRTLTALDCLALGDAEKNGMLFGFRYPAAGSDLVGLWDCRNPAFLVEARNSGEVTRLDPLE